MAAIASSSDLVIFLTIFVTIFVAELTDKDALFLVALATTARPRTVFAAGALAFTATTAVVVTLGSLLITVVPILWVKLAGGTIMLAYAAWELAKLRKSGTSGSEEKTRFPKRLGMGARAFLSAILALALLDLAGDATELLLIVFVARFEDILLVFLAGASSLVTATALETIAGYKLGSVLSARGVRYASVGIFTLIGAFVLVSTLL